MEAKEKAEELLDKFMNSDNMIFLIEGAKECALIAVDEILNEFPNGFNGNFEMKRKLYWEEVKQEIKQYKNGKK